MQRRHFLQATGGFVTTSAFLSLITANKDHNRRDDFNMFKSPILKAIAMGLNAPSAHNTQAWKFKIINETSALLYIDENRLLPHTDPFARQIHISAGCFLEALAIGCTGIGYKSSFLFFPEGTYASNDIGTKAIASIALAESIHQAKHPLWSYIFTRRTNRTVYSGSMISNDEFNKISADCQMLHSKALFINNSTEIETYKTIFSKAMEMEFNTLVTNEETRKMFRFSDEGAATKRDGLTFEANGLTGFKKKMAESFTKNTQESWNSKGIISKGLANFNKGLDSARGFVLWITTENTFESQIQHGRDFYQFWLALTKNQVYLHPLNQANEEYAEMDLLRKQLDELVGIKDNEKIQMIVRIGRSEESFESYRRHLDNFIVK